MYEPQWRIPKSIGEALAALSEAGEDGTLISGGTDLTSLIGKGVVRPRVLVDLGRVDELRVLDLDSGGPHGDRVGIGATVTHATLARDEVVRRVAPVLAAACGTVGGPQIRARGTIGGNVANASPAADGTVALFALGAAAVVQSEGGPAREVPLRELLTAPGETVLRPTELITKFVFDRPSQGTRGVYSVIGQRNALAIAIASVAVLHEPEAGSVSIALGSVAPTPIRATAAERIFSDGWGGADREGLYREVAAEAARAASPVDDVRASAWYRRQLVEVLTRRALEEACA
jgi:CO/xanthine dehydrogenase FAD-binding subunit